MKNIMFLCCNFTFGGVEQYILNVIDNIDRNKYNISVMLPANMVYDNENVLYSRNVPVYKLTESKMSDKLREFQSIIQSEKINIVHITLGYSAFTYAKAALKTKVDKVIIHSHTSKSGNENINLINKIARKIYFLYANRFICKKTVNLACSDLAAKYLFSKSTKVEIVWNGIDIDKFRNAQEDEKIYNKYGIDKNKINILTVGRMDNQKNPMFLIKVFNELVNINKNYNLVYVGSGPLKEQIYNLEKSLKLKDYIVHIPHTNEVSKLMKCCNAFLLPSLYEGLGIVVIEAQASGLRCFCSDKVPSLADCGNCRYIDLGENERVWAKIIDDEINNSEASFITDKAKLNKYSIKTTVKRLEQIYK